MNTLRPLCFAATLALSPLVGAEPAAGTPAPAPATKTARPAALCPPETGSRLKRRANPDGSCGNTLPGSRSYSQEDLQRTGQTDLGKALPQIDPSLTRGGR